MNYMGQIEDNLTLRMLKEKLDEYPSIEISHSQSILPGDDKNVVVEKSIAEVDIFLALFSSKWPKKDDVYYKNIVDAIKRHKNLPRGKTFIIPVKLDECDISSYTELEKLEELNLFEITDSREEVFDKKIIRLVRAIAKGSDNKQLDYELVTLLNDDYEGKNDEQVKEITKYADKKYANAKERVKMTPKECFMAGLYRFVCRGKENYEVAKARFEDALARGMKDASVFSKIGACDIRLENWNEAIKHLNRAIEIDKSYPSAYFNRGIWYKCKGEKHLEGNDSDKALQMFEEALTSFEKAAMLLKDKNTKDYLVARTKNNISTTEKAMYLLTGEVSFLNRAINALESLIRSDPRTEFYGFELIRYNLACYYSLKGNLAETYIHLKVAFEDYLNVEYSITDIELHNFKLGCFHKYKELIKISSNDYIEKLQHEIKAVIKQKKIEELSEVVSKNEEWLKNIGNFNANAYHLLAYCYDSIGDIKERDNYLDEYRTSLYTEISQKILK